MELEPQLNQYTIREANDSDVEAIRRMQAQSWRDTYRNDEIGVTDDWLERETTNWFTPERLDASRQWLGNVFPDPMQLYRVAYRGNEVVGLAHFSTREDGIKRVEGLYTAKDTLGTGLAQQLMEQATEFMGDAEAELEVASYNERAKAFYRKYGFVETDKQNELFRDKIPSTTMIRPQGCTSKLKGDQL